VLVSVLRLRVMVSVATQFFSAAEIRRLESWAGGGRADELVRYLMLTAEVESGTLEGSAVRAAESRRWEGWVPAVEVVGE
jgi:hypothetical protein